MYYELTVPLFVFIVTLAKAGYDRVFSGTLSPGVFVHSDGVLSLYLAALRPSGTLHLVEPVLVGAPLASSSGSHVPTKTAEELTKSLKVRESHFSSRCAASFMVFSS